MSRTQNLCPQQTLRARANGETFVSATMCPRLPGPTHRPIWKRQAVPSAGKHAMGAMPNTRKRT